MTAKNNTDSQSKYNITAFNENTFFGLSFGLSFFAVFGDCRS